MKVNTFLLIALVALMCSCSDDVLNEGSRYSAQPVPRVTFSFDSITAPNVWAQYQSLEEMLAACQIPEEKLNSMSTDELIDVCMSHPLHALYFAYNNEMVGAKVVFEHFNGFSELKKRKDAPTKMLAFYDDINFNAATPKVHREDFSKITYMGFIELYLASKELTSLYTEVLHYLPMPLKCLRKSWKTHLSTQFAARCSSTLKLSWHKELFLKRKPMP